MGGVLPDQHLTQYVQGRGRLLGPAFFPPRRWNTYSDRSPHRFGDFVHKKDRFGEKQKESSIREPGEARKKGRSRCVTGRSKKRGGGYLHCFPLSRPRSEPGAYIQGVFLGEGIREGSCPSLGRRAVRTRHKAILTASIPLHDRWWAGRWKPMPGEFLSDRALWVWFLASKLQQPRRMKKGREGGGDGGSHPLPPLPTYVCNSDSLWRKQITYCYVRTQYIQ